MVYGRRRRADRRPERPTRQPTPRTPAPLARRGGVVLGLAPASAPIRPMLNCGSRAIRRSAGARGKAPREALTRPGRLTMMASRRAQDGAGLATARTITDTPGGIPASDDKGVTMRFGHWRGVTLAVALISAMATGRSASADGFHHTIPREVPAVDLNTGRPVLRPADPLRPLRQGRPVRPSRPRTAASAACSPARATATLRAGLLRPAAARAAATAAAASAATVRSAACGHGGDGCGDPGCGGSAATASGQGLRPLRRQGLRPLHVERRRRPDPRPGVGPVPAPPGSVVTSPQAAPIASAQACADPGCKLGKGHHHGDGLGMGDPCGGCGGKGCGLCGGLGRLFGARRPCDACGGKGCGHCGGLAAARAAALRRQGLRPLRSAAACKGKLSGLLHPHAARSSTSSAPAGRSR